MNDKDPVTNITEDVLHFNTLDETDADDELRYLFSASPPTSPLPHIFDFDISSATITDTFATAGAIIDAPVTVAEEVFLHDADLIDLHSEIYVSDDDLHLGHEQIASTNAAKMLQH